MGGGVFLCCLPQAELGARQVGLATLRAAQYQPFRVSSGLTPRTAPRLAPRPALSL